MNYGETLTLLVESALGTRRVYALDLDPKRSRVLNPWSFMSHFGVYGLRMTFLGLNHHFGPFLRYMCVKVRTLCDYHAWGGQIYDYME